MFIWLQKQIPIYYQILSGHINDIKILKETYKKGEKLWII